MKWLIITILTKIYCLFKSHRWVDVTYTDDALTRGPTLRYCRRCRREERRFDNGYFNADIEWKQIL